MKVFKFVRNHKHAAAMIGAIVISIASTAAALGAGQTLKPVVGLTLHDARGRLVGAVLDQPQEGEAQIVLKAGTRLIALRADRSRLMETPSTVGTPLYYTSGNCTGQPYEAHNANEMPSAPNSFFATDIAWSSGKLYIWSGPAQTIQVNSMANETTGACEPQGSFESFEHFGIPLAFLADLAQFQPPYSIRGITID